MNHFAFNFFIDDETTGRSKPRANIDFRIKNFIETKRRQLLLDFKNLYYSFQPQGLFAVKHNLVKVHFWEKLEVGTPS